MLKEQLKEAGPPDVEPPVTTTISLPKSLHQSAKIRAITTDRTLSAYIAALIEHDIIGDMGEPA